MLKNPEIYKDMGAKMEKALLLHGNPGTGKTTMAECLIRSTGRKTFTCRKKVSDGSFINEIVKTFEKAKEKAPSIVFLDDMDKFSDKNTDDSENAEEFVAIQACLDEIKDEDVFVIATANDINRLPDSLLRPGRFGRIIRISPPRKDEAIEIIRHYLKKTKTGDDLDPESIAMMLEGESCATLEDIVRNSAMKAAFNRQDQITMKNIIDSCLDLLFEAAESDKPYSEDVLKRTAYHEGGHALVAELLDPGSVSIVSIRSTGSETMGFVRYCRKDSEECTYDYYVNMLKTSLAGKASTEIVFGEPDIGCNTDMHHAFDRAKRIVDNFCVYGFQSWIEDIHDINSAENRNRMMAMVMEQSYMDVKRLLIQNHELLDILVEELLHKTTLVHADIQKIMNSFDSRRIASDVRRGQ